MYITLNIQDSLFETIIQTYSIRNTTSNGSPLEKWRELRNQIEFGIVQLNTFTIQYKVFSAKYNIIFDGTMQSKFYPASLVKNKSYFFTNQDFENLKVFLEKCQIKQMK